MAASKKKPLLDLGAGTALGESGAPFTSCTIRNDADCYVPSGTSTSQSSAFTTDMLAGHTYQATDGEGNQLQGRFFSFRDDFDGGQSCG